MIKIEKAIRFRSQGNLLNATPDMVRVYADMTWKEYCHFLNWVKKENENNGTINVENSIREV